MVGDAGPAVDAPRGDRANHETTTTATTRFTICLRSSHHHRAQQAIEPRKFTIEVHVAALEQRLLLAGADPAAGCFAVLAVQRVGHVHALDHASERGEALR